MLNRGSGGFTKFLKLNQWSENDKPKRLDFVNDNIKIDKKAEDFFNSIEYMVDEGVPRYQLEIDTDKEIKYNNYIKDKVISFLDDFQIWGRGGQYDRRVATGVALKKVHMSSGQITPYMGTDTHGENDFWVKGGEDLRYSKFILVVNTKPGEDHRIMLLHVGKHNIVCISLSGYLYENMKWKPAGISIRWGKKGERKWNGEKRFITKTRNSSLPDTEIVL